MKPSCKAQSRHSSCLKSRAVRCTLTIATALLLVASLPSVMQANACCSARKPADDTLVGIYYFAGWWPEMPNKWHGGGWDVNSPDWRLEFPGRVPLLGAYNDQETMDREIEAAATHGVDFFAILYYYPMEGSGEFVNAQRANRGLEYFIASPNASMMQFYIEYTNALPFTARTDEEWNECIGIWLEAMQHPSYMRVDDRLVFVVHDTALFMRLHDYDIDKARQRIAILRNAVRDAGLGEMIIGCGIVGNHPPIPGDWTPTQIFDFTTTYMPLPEVETREEAYPYSLLADELHRSIKIRLTDPMPWMPTMGAGWNPRPWTYPDSAPHYRRFFEFPTRSEFTHELRTMQETLSNNPSFGMPRRDGTQQKAFIIYAWNEFGEGGMMAPTQGKGYMYLESIREVFGK